MRVRFTNHALQRMVERGVSNEDVRLVLEEPDASVGLQDGKTVSSKRIRGETVKVVHIRSGDDMVIITVMTR